MTEHELEKLESVANGLRGVSLDPRLPDDVRQFLATKAKEMDSVLDPHTNIDLGCFEDDESQG